MCSPTQMCALKGQGPGLVNVLFVKHKPNYTRGTPHTTLAIVHRSWCANRAFLSESGILIAFFPP